MQPDTTPEARPRRAGAGRLRVMLRIAEFLLLAGLLVIDFEIGARELTVTPGNEALLGAFATALVAIVIAVLMLARNSVPGTIIASAAFGVSLLASLVSALIGSPSISLTETAALLVITAFVIRTVTPRIAIVIGAAALLVALAAVLLRVGLDATLILLAILIWGCAISAGVVSRYFSMRRESAVEAARREERMELARELHDVVAHQVTGIVVQAQAAIVVARKDPERLTEVFEAIESAGSEALAGMRKMVGAIRDESEENAPLTVPYELADIPTLVERFDPEGAHTFLQFEVGETRMPPGVAESAYRIVREALTNVRRHAPKGSTRIAVRVVDAALTIEVHNDQVRSRSIDSGSRGFGITGMAERVHALGGTFEAGPGEPGTWAVRVSLPLAATR
ncbi:sensor histidine kinase [Humidisolicoccus flavus]|uniref:sensor histidine kinase n=1 Tax=Humidisolicoccus flavus TaxID=3111414 RepID=UPI003249E9E6